jgi:sugar phosphate permease
MDKSLEESQASLLARSAVLGWLCFAAAIAYVHRNSLGAAESAVRDDLSLGLDEMGVVLSSFFWGYALFQIPSGWLADRWGTRRLLTLLALSWSVATGATMFAGDYATLTSLRFLSGAAQAGIFSCATRSISHWFPGSQRGITSGLLGSSMSVGGAVGAMVTGMLLAWLNWRWIMFWYAIPGLLWSAGFYAWFRDRPVEHTEVRGPDFVEPTAARQNSPARDASAPRLDIATWHQILASPTMWWIAGQQFFRAAGYVFYASWFATFLKETRGISLDKAAFLTGLPLWAVVIGSPLGGLVTDWVLGSTGNRRLARSGVAAASMFACALLVACAFPVQDAVLAVLLISAGSFCSAIGGPCAYAVTIDVGGDRVGTVFSVMNMCGNIGAAAFPLAVPPLVMACGSWNPVLFVFAAIYALAGLCWLLIDPEDNIVADPVANTHSSGNSR